MQPPRFLYDLENCSIARSLDIVGEKWSLLVIREAFYGVQRFDDFIRALGCGRAILSNRLRTLTDVGVLEREDYQEAGQRPRAAYRLTEMGRDLFPTLFSLSQWGDRWLPPPEGPVADVRERGTGLPVRAVMTSDPGVHALTVRDLDIRPGPGAKRIGDSG